MKRITLLLAVLSLMMLRALVVSAQNAQMGADDFLPRVQSGAATNCGNFAKGGTVSIVSNDESDVMLREFVAMCGFTVSDDAERTITVTIDTDYGKEHDYQLKGFDNEAYRLEVCQQSIAITAASHMGVCRAVATLMQMAEGSESLASCSIADYPAFKLRGFMHDVGRSYVTVEELKKEIKLYARFKVNCFHWHLTENQAWRFEVKAYPQLTSSSSMTRFPGLYYTQEDCREIDQLCHDYGIVLIPELDMPGHSAAFERAMGHSMQSDAGYAELKNILDEAGSVFIHAPYIHIGGDEVTITRANFLEDMIAKVHSLGKYAMVWNPIRGVNVAGLDADMVQLWSTSGRKISGKANIDCRYNYTNHFDVFADLAGIYLSQIYYQTKGDSEIAGELSCPWNDRKTPTQEDIIRQNNVWANTIASASRAWQGGGKGYIETQGAVLPNSGEQYEDFADWERRFLLWQERWLADESIPYVKQTNIRWRLTDMMSNGGNASTVLAPETEGPKDTYTVNGQTVNTRIVTGGGVYLRHTWGGTVPCVFGDPSTGNTAYAWTYFYSETEQDAGALIEFQNYGRSENDAAPSAGNWDRKGSRVWFNDEELIAPNWKNAGKSINSEVDLQDENFTARAPYPVHVKKGWNKVFLKLPYVASGCRLNKWMWTFVITTPDGKRALDGIRYSPDQASDAAAEELLTLIGDIVASVNSKVSDRIGYYRRESAAALFALVESVRATLGDEMTAEERAAQKTQLQAAYDDFLAHYQEGGINLPKASSGDDEHWYTLQSKRASRYALCNGTNSAMTGNATLSEAGHWKFTERADGTFNIVSRTGLFISPKSANNSALKTVTAEPSAGWTIKKADDEGYVIITSGTVEFNQTNLNGNQVYNWGGGNNTSDEGCQYLIADAPKIPVTSIKYSTDSRAYYYYMYTPNRDSRYPTSYGENQPIVGNVTTSEASAWKFVQREDGTCDIVNFADHTYVTPDVAYNTALKTVGEQPSAGWTLRHSGGYWFVYSGATAQFNQTNNATLGYNVYNWYGTGAVPNTSDTGCQYLIVEADVQEDVLLLGDVDGSGELGTQDVAMLVAYLIGDDPMGFHPEAADVNQDERIDVLDVTEIIDAILGKARR